MKIHHPWPLKHAVLTSVFSKRTPCPRCKTGCASSADAVAHCYNKKPAAPVAVEEASDA